MSAGRHQLPGEPGHPGNATVRQPASAAKKPHKLAFGTAKLWLEVRRAVAKLGKEKRRDRG